MWHREEQMFIVLTVLMTPPVLNTRIHCVCSQNRRKEALGGARRPPPRWRRRADSKLQPASTQTLHFSSSGENQTAGGNTAADEALKHGGRRCVRDAAAAAAGNARQLGLINLQLKLSESESGACRELIHDHHTHFVGLQRVQYFLY